MTWDFGKTLQMLSVVLSYLNETKKDDRKPCIVVCPSSLSLNWKKEAEKFAKDIKCMVISGSAFELKKKIFPKYC